MADSNEVFRASNGEPANFHTGTIKVKVNGQSFNARYAVGHMTIGQAVDQIAKEKGIRTFSVYADNEKLTTDDAKTPATEFEEIDIVAKDSRGSR